MLSARLSSVAAHANGVLHGDDRAFSGVSTDSRGLLEDKLFVALRGPNFDGHDFVAAAAEGRAAGALVAKRQPVELPQIQVSDTLSGLQEWAAAWRRSTNIPLVAITGSNGKTTVKTLAASILSQRFETLATRGNLNNHIGVPLTLLELSSKHEVAVVEMGASARGEIGPLTRLAEPTVGIVTNAGPAHLEGFGDIRGVALGKGELFESLPEKACAVINADDVYHDQWRQLAQHCRIVTFGTSDSADYALANAPEIHANGMTFSARLGDAGVVAIETPLVGSHNILNILAAAAAATAAGAQTEDIVAGVAGAGSVAGRMNVCEGRGGVRIIDDAYNANPASLAAGIDYLATQKGRRLLVLGDMAELGSDARALHVEAGEFARSRGIDGLVGVGPLAAHAARAYGPGSQTFATLEEARDWLEKQLGRDLVLLIKGSRSAGLDRLVEALQSERTDAD